MTAPRNALGQSTILVRMITVLVRMGTILVRMGTILVRWQKKGLPEEANAVPLA